MAASTSMRPALNSSSKARRASLSTVRFRRSLQQEIRAARLEAGEIERHVDVAELAQALHDRLAQVALPEPRHLGLVDLEPGQAIVVTYPELAKAEDRKSTRLNSSHSQISYAVFCLKKKKN